MLILFLKPLHEEYFILKHILFANSAKSVVDIVFYGPPYDINKILLSLFYIMQFKVQEQRPDYTRICRH